MTPAAKAASASFHPFKVIQPNEFTSVKKLGLVLEAGRPNNTEMTVY